MKNSLRRIFALALVVMMIAALGMSAFAAEGDPIESVEFTKNLTKDENVYAPATTYTFTIVPGTADTVNSVFAGVANGAKFVTGENTTSATLTITSDPATGTGTWTYAGEIVFDTTVFGHPGIYRYTVAESESDYAGITADTAARTLDICVEETEEGFEVTAVQLYYTPDGATAAVKDGVFTNVYETANLTISNAVTGNLGEMEREFEFSIQIDGADGEKYYAVVEGITDPVELTSGEKYDFTLANSDTIVIYGLSEDDTYTITHEDCDDEGYETTISGEATDTLESADDFTVAYTYNREATVPTGIAMTVLPFVAMIALAAIVAVLFFQKRERREA